MKKLLSFLFLIVLLAGVGFTVYYLTIPESDTAPEDSSALYGGELESGYPSAGYLVTQTPGSTKTCGYTVLNKQEAITASHCVDEATDMFLGKAEYKPDLANTLKVSTALQKEGWISEKRRTEDFAILKFSDTEDFFTDFAEVASPTEGCHYRIVAYGRTENPDDPLLPRKSALVCASEITSDTFKLKGTGDSGICFGDSGSPIYFEDTNQVVGVTASIVNRVPNDPNPCDFGNTAIVVRADANKELIENFVQASDPYVPDPNAPTEFSIEVADETFFESIGLQSIEDLDQKQKYTYLLYVTIAGIVIIVAGLLYIVLKDSD